MATRPLENPAPACLAASMVRGQAWGTVRPQGGQESFPNGWHDPLELYGCFRRQLAPPGFDPATERVQVRQLLKGHAAQWVWRNRHRLVSLRKFMARNKIDLPVESHANR